MGIIYLILKIKDLDVEFGDCGFIEPADCNGPHWNGDWFHGRGVHGPHWRSVFTLNPVILLDLWTPVIIGALGVCIHLKSLNFPYVKNYETYAVFMVVTALFANVGYAAQLGVIIAFLSGVAALMCLVARLTGEKALKPLDIGKA